MIVQGIVFVAPGFRYYNINLFSDNCLYSELPVGFASIVTISIVIEMANVIIVSWYCMK